MCVVCGVGAWVAYVCMRQATMCANTVTAYSAHVEGRISKACNQGDALTLTKEH